MKHHKNRLSYSEWGDYFNPEKKAKAIAFGTWRKFKVIKKIKHCGKDETSWKIGYCIVNEAIILALRKEHEENMKKTWTTWKTWNRKKN